MMEGVEVYNTSLSPLCRGQDLPLIVVAPEQFDFAISRLKEREASRPDQPARNSQK